MLVVMVGFATANARISAAPTGGGVAPQAAWSRDGEWIGARDRGAIALYHPLAEAEVARCAVDVLDLPWR